MQATSRAGYNAVFWACLASSTACVSTALDEAPRPPVCKATGASAGADAVVQVTAYRKAEVVWCSGVAIAPTLILTALGCVSELSDPRQADPVEELELTGGPALDLGFGAVEDYSMICDRDDGWAALEDGTFAGRLGERLDPTAIDVTPLPPNFDPAVDTPQTVKAADIFTSRSSSRCRDDIAVLRLEEPLSIPRLTLRLGMSDSVGDAVTISNICSNEDVLARRELPSQVRSVTRDASSSELPPRSLLLAAELDVNAPGGAVLTDDTGALLGMIVTGTTTSCGTQTSEGTTFATRIDSFRGMLFDAAAAAGEALALAPDASNGSFLRSALPCSAP